MERQECLVTLPFRYTRAAVQHLDNGGGLFAMAVQLDRPVAAVAHGRLPGVIVQKELVGDGCQCVAGVSSVLVWV